MGEDFLNRSGHKTVEKTQVVYDPRNHVLSEIANKAEQTFGPGDPKHREGTLRTKHLADGREVCLTHLLFGNVRLSIGEQSDMIGYDDCWDYDSIDVAILAFIFWNGYDEPPGWVRHPATGRRRPFGDPRLEYYAP